MLVAVTNYLIIFIQFNGMAPPRDTSRIPKNFVNESSTTSVIPVTNPSIEN